MKNIKKKNEISYCLGGKFKTQGGKFPPLKALKKTLHVGGHTKSIEKINKSSEATLGIITCSYTLNFELQDECHE